MKKKFIAFLTAAVLMLALVLPAGCGIFESFLSDSSTPYDVAVERGETGSRESWLASLETPSSEFRRAFEEAKADGSFTGTYFEFLQELGVQTGDRIQSSLFSVVNIFAYFESSAERSLTRVSGFTPVPARILSAVDCPMPYT